ncbi:MAG: GNAT family N-acetyltransferase [Candidatus Limnocylindrales bacterium]
MTIAISETAADAPEAVALIEELEAHLSPQYPATSRHGFSVERLLRERVAFFVGRIDGEPAACGGILLVPGEYAEVKRMYVRPAFRGRGVGRAILEQLAAHALENGLPVVRLETGIHQADAIAMYERAGFRQVPPFGPYRDDPLSRCYERIDGAASGAG